ncbi:MAG: hypothetical protein KC713_05270 [Candidatus Omnitrophica bacterium]|nr:hypothetical protein [Candidatus Omnitrophota bacterium]
MGKSDWLNRFAIIAVIFLSAYFVILYFTDPALLKWFCDEDGLLESTSVLFYAAASLIFLLGCRNRRWKNIWYWGYFLLFFFIAGEEISWGQRILGLATPESMKTMNVQGEMNLHNVDGIHDHIRMVGTLIILTICYVLPVANFCLRPIKTFLSKIKMPIFPLKTWLIPTLAILFMVIPRLYGAVVFELDEVGEFYLSICFFVFAVHAHKDT